MSKYMKYTRPLYANDIKFSYYGDTASITGHVGIITICSYINKEHNIVEYGVSYCSPSDKYDKHYGKFIAYSRMVNDKFSVDFSKKNHQEINTKIFASIITFGEYPSWAKIYIYNCIIHHAMRCI